MPWCPIKGSPDSNKGDSNVFAKCVPDTPRCEVVEKKLKSSGLGHLDDICPTNTAETLHILTLVICTISLLLILSNPEL